MVKDMNETDVAKTAAKLIILVICFIFLLIIVFSSFYMVSAGQRAILLTWGNPSQKAIAEGLHFKIPIAQSVVIMDIKTQKYEAELSAASNDLQDVNTKIAINYHVVPELTPEIYQTIGLNYAEKVIYPYEQETNKGITSLFTAVELIQKREEVRAKMKADLAEKLIGRGIVIEEVSIINFQFSPSFTQSIEMKVKAEQDALTEKNKLETIKYQAQQVEAAAIGQKNAAIAQAQGNAEAIRIIDEQLKKSSNYIEYYKLQKWDGVLPKVTGGAIPLVSVE